MSTGTAMAPQNMTSKPRLIFWELTKGCNLRCVHCRATATELSSPLDLPTAKAREIIEQIASYANPILVLSGGEPLFRRDVFELARLATDRGLRVALATNGTLVTKDVATKIVASGVKRVSISLDGADAETHDTFRGIPGAFEAAIYGLRNLKQLGMQVQINMTIARHNADQLPAVLDLAKNLGADALHTFLLVPVGCGVDIAAEQMVNPDEYERMLHWFYDRSLEGGIELKATCAPHYFRVVRQRRAAERKESGYGAHASQASTESIGPTDMMMPGSTGVIINKNRELGGIPTHGHPGGHPSGGHPDGMNAMTKGCLAGTGVCFVSHQGEVFPCGYLPTKAGDLRSQSFRDVWENSIIFEQLRDTGNLKGKCGCCEFRNVCMGCRARAFAATGDMMAEEPFCVYQPRMSEPSRAGKAR
ncbi:MAG TPA: radical SAM protein [Terriglobales bacterium]|nr:radical SAM protein [Terriglobales bacterium]